MKRWLKENKSIPGLVQSQYFKVPRKVTKDGDVCKIALSIPGTHSKSPKLLTTHGVLERIMALWEKQDDQQELK